MGPVAALWALGTHALPGGAPWEAAVGEGCVQCHFDAPAIEDSPAVTIEGLPQRIEPGTVYPLVVRLDDAMMRNAGFLLSAWQQGKPAGAFTAADERTSTQAAQARSTAAGAAVPATGRVEWQLEWTAPRTSTAAAVRFELWANSGNDDASPLGDQTHRRAWQVPTSAGGANAAHRYTPTTNQAESSGAK